VRSAILTGMPTGRGRCPHDTEVAQHPTGHLYHRNWQRKTDRQPCGVPYRAQRSARKRHKPWTGFLVRCYSHPKVVKEASARAGIQVLALRPSQHGDAGEPAPVHPHLFRHARVRQLVHSTKSLPLAQKQAGWSRLQMAYLTIGDDEARELMRGVPE